MELYSIVESAAHAANLVWLNIGYVLHDGSVQHYLAFRTIFSDITAITHLLGPNGLA